MRLHDLVDVLFIHVAVPDSLGVHDGDGATGTAIQAARLVHPHLARAQQAQCLGLALAPIKGRLRLVLRAAVFAVVALVQAEKDVALVVGESVL